jgi:hypothetical protein
MRRASTCARAAWGHGRTQGDCPKKETVVVGFLASDDGRVTPSAGFDGEWEWAADYSDVKGDYGVKMQSAGELSFVWDLF